MNKSLKTEGQETAQEDNKIEDDNIIIDNATNFPTNTIESVLKISTTEKKVVESWFQNIIRTWNW